MKRKQYKFTEQHRLNMSKGKVGHMVSEETRRKISETQKKNGMSEEALAHFDRIRLKGKPLTEEHRKNIGNSIRGEKNPAWKGDKIGYRGIHHWIVRTMGKPYYCEHCKKSDLPHRSYHWANISGEYKRIVSDWKRLCVKCHKEFDKK